jgi:hypothetical protein
MAVPETVQALVERFDRNRDAYTRGGYNETQARREFIDPLFAALGWDVDNTQGYAEAYKDVVHEDAIKVGRATKAPDYSFRIGGARKFFVEAKKPSVDIKDDLHPAYQLRRYGWSAKLPLSILTDFEEFAVYDCRVKPEKTDKASKARTLYLTYADYADRWDELSGIFSREAILKGAFDKYAAAHKDKRGTAEVDVEFLREIERWRDLLARNIALRNPRLTRRELNFAVQRTIDRIIFLRICEDRGIERYGRLMALQNGARVYARLLELFQQADDRYNSGIFHFKVERDHPEAPDALTPALTIDDGALKDILNNLYYPDSPYEFSVLPADILGQVYEQFLGKVIRLTAGHQAKVEDKPEVKKAGGVFYTPTYIVDYIVAHTVGALLQAATPKQAAALTILDPACGSGSFLLGAYQYLLDWQRNAYVGDNPDKWAKGRQPRLCRNDRGEWKLTIEERKRLLLTHIYGVDIDAQAVEVTKLSLLLKVLEGEDEQTITSQMALFQQRVLPDLSRNIKCGNSLIGSDFYIGQQLTLLDEEELYRINAFDWDKEFPEILGNGGFDAIIGNPPYGAALSDTERAYLRGVFQDESKALDTYELFLLQAPHLLNQHGRISMIIPSSWLTGEKYAASRQKLVTDLYPTVAYALPFDIFKRAYVDTAIVVFSVSPIENCFIYFFPKREKLVAIPDHIGHQVPVSAIRQDEASRLCIVFSQESASIIRKINAAPVQLSDWFNISRGVQPYSRKKHTETQIKSRFLHADSQKSPDYLPELQGNELLRYSIAPQRTSYLKYSDEIASIRPMKMFAGKRIVLRRLLTRKFRLQASLATDTMITTDNVLNLIPRNDGVCVEFALGVFNSTLVSWLYVNSSTIAQKDDFPQVYIGALSAIRLPVYQQHQCGKMIQLVTTMLDLHTQLRAAAIPQTRALLQRQIEAADCQIDRLVYDLYGLTAEEIAIVEKG